MRRGPIRNDGCRRLALAGFLLLASAIAPACGTRIEGAQTPVESPPRSTSAAAALDTTTVPSDEKTGPPGQTPDSVRGGKASGPRPGSSPSGVRGTSSPLPATRPASSALTGSRSSAPPHGGSAPPPVGTASPPPGAPTAPVPRVPGRDEPLVLASVGSYSGPAATASVPILRGAQLWVKATNAKGGLNRHPIKLIVFDDGADLARHRSQVQEAIERHHVLAFLANVEGLSGEPSVEYVNEKRVPIVGSSSAEAYVYRSPMHFIQMSNGMPLAKTFTPSISEQVTPRGLSKIGTLVCVEASSCPEIEKEVAASAAAYGLKAVYQGRASIAQPDFTAECLAARNAGVEILLVILDPSSLGRVARSCTRQSFRPVFSITGVALVDSLKDNPDLDGLVASTGVFPYFQTGTPATDEFHEAVKAYSGPDALSVGLAVGWTAGKLLEHAAARLPEPPTRDGLLAALWSLKADDLGGLAYPLTFTAHQPAEPVSCWFDISLHKGAWISPDGYQLHCLPRGNR